MPRKPKISAEHEAAIKAALLEHPHASLVTRDSKGAWSYSTVWRVADRNSIALTEGRETMGRRRLSAEQRAAVIELSRANPGAKQKDIARATGISRSSVSRIEGGRRRLRLRCQP